MPKYNSLPRNSDLEGWSVDKFKNELDNFLKNLPDTPLIPGYTASSPVENNSIVDWCNWQSCVHKYDT